MVEDDGLTVSLELIRVEQADDPGAFHTGVQEYLLRGDEGSYASASLTWDEALLHWLAEIRAPGRDPAIVQALGDRLRRFLVAGGLAALDDRIARALAERRPLRVEIVAGAAELLALPWELLTLGNRHLGELPGVEIQYRWPGGQAAAPARSPVQEGGRVLVAYSRGGDPLGEQFAIEAIAAAASAGGGDFDPARDVVADASLPAIVAAIEAGIAAGAPPVALHLLCHGAPIGSGYGLRLGDGRGGATVVDSRTLRGALAPLADRVRLVVLMACDSGNPGVAGTRLGSVASELHRAGFAAVVASRYPVGGAAALAFTRHFYTHMFAGSCSIEQAFRLARERLVREGSADWSTFQVYSHAAAGAGTRPFVVRPYRGLLAFEREHAALFFGREREHAETLQDLDALIAAGRPRLLAVVGASGTGKSSLVLAPVRVALEGRGWHVSVMRPGREPGEALAAALRSLPPDRPGVVVVDQFEEVFTHCVDRDRLAEASAFVRALWELATRAVVIVTVRVDYLGRCGELVLDDTGARLDRVVYDEAHRVFVAQMTPEALRAVVERPARRVGLRLEAGLVERLVREVAGESNALPLLEYVLDELWRRRSGELLTHAALDAVGGVTGALARHADTVIDALDESGREQARRTLVRLVVFGSDAASGARRREDERELRSRRAPEAWERATHALIAARLLVRREEVGGVASLEIAHEALIRRWDRLWRWFEAERDRLGRRRELDKLLEQWKQYGPLAGKALALGQELVRGLDDDDLAPEARTMLAVSEARARRQLRTRRVLIGTALATLGAFALIVGVLYVRANRAANRSQAAQRIAVAGRFVTSRPHLAAALLHSVDTPDLPGWRQAAFTTLQSPLPTLVDAAAGGEVIGAAFAPDGGLVLARTDGGLQMFPPDGPGMPVVAGAGRIADIEVSRDGADVYVLRPPQLEVWDRAGTAPRGAVDVGAAATRLHVGAGTGAVVVEASDGTSVWAPVDGRLEARGVRPRARAIEAGRELLLRADGDDSVVVETWFGEQVGRHGSPGIGRALDGLAGLYLDDEISRVVAWSWSGGADFGRQEIATPYLAQGLMQIAALADRTVFQAKREDFGVEATRLCVQAIGDAAAHCVELAPGCYFAGVHEGLARIDCADHVQLRRIETLALGTTLAGPDATRSQVFGDGRRVALLATDTSVLWRWDMRPPPSGLSILGRGWFTLAPLGYYRVPTLQAGRGRVVAALWDKGLKIMAWLLRPDAIDRPPESFAVDVSIGAGDEHPREQVFADDAFLVTVARSDGQGARVVVGAIDGARITTRSVRLPRPELDIAALAPDGRHAYCIERGALVRLDLRGDEAHEEVVPGVSIAGHQLVIGPDGRYLVSLGSPTVVDLSTNAVLQLDPDLARMDVSSAAFAPDGVTLALGAQRGEIVLARIRPEGDVQRRATLPGHRASADALAFSSDGASLVSADGARQLFVWTELESPAPRSVTLEVPEPIWHIGFSPDDKQVWALSQLGELRFWSMFADDAALRLELAARAPCLPARQWTQLADIPESEAEAFARAHCPATRRPQATPR